MENTENNKNIEDDDLDETIVVNPDNCDHKYKNYISALRYFISDDQFDYYYCKICGSEIKKKK